MQSSQNQARHVCPILLTILKQTQVTDDCNKKIIKSVEDILIRTLYDSCGDRIII